MVIPCNVTQILHGVLLNIKTYSPEVSNIQRRETDSEKIRVLNAYVFYVKLTLDLFEGLILLNEPRKMVVFKENI